MENTADYDYDEVARELVRALRGRRSCAELSRRAGYRSNIVQRWEAGRCWPTAARFLAVRERLRPTQDSWLERFFATAPVWVRGLDPVSPDAVAAFLRHLKGKTPIVRIAALSGRNRYTVSRWLEGRAEPRLPDFLRLVDVSSRRLVDLVACLEDPQRLPSVRARHQQLQRAREAAYERPLSHAVLRALELEGAPRVLPQQVAWIAARLGLGHDVVRDALALLADTGQVRRTRTGYRLVEVTAVDTSRDPTRARALKLAWTETALERLRGGAQGSFGYSLFAVSRVDLERLQALHLQYVRAMQDVIASSAPSECVGLYCAQLLDLDPSAAT